MSRLERFETICVGLFAVACGLIMMALAILGPGILGAISYATSPSGIIQLRAQDAVDLLLMGPILIGGGLLYAAGRNIGKYLVALTPIFTIYYGLSTFLGNEWSTPNYVGQYNVHGYWWMFLALIVGGLIILVGILPKLQEAETPIFGRHIKTYVLLMAIFLTLFSGMWINQMIQVVSIGDLPNQAYSTNPTAFWVIRSLDLGFCIPLGFISLYLLLTRPKTAFGAVLLFFGFFITQITAVFAMGVLMILSSDPTANIGELAVFSGLLALVYGGFYYIVRWKLPKPWGTRPTGSL